MTRRGKEGSLLHIVTNNGRAINAEVFEGQLIYIIARGDGTNLYFSTFEKAFEYTVENPRR